MSAQFLPLAQLIGQRVSSRLVMTTRLPVLWPRSHPQNFRCLMLSYTPPSSQRSLFYQPHTADSQDLTIHSSSRSLSFSHCSRLEQSTDTLIITLLSLSLQSSVHSDSTLPRSLSPTSTPLACPPLRLRSVQGLHTGLNNSKTPYIPGYLSNLSIVPS